MGMKDAFNEADKEGKGKLSANEVKDVLSVVVDIDIDIDFAEMLMRIVDDDGDKMLNYEELVKLFTNEPCKPGENWKSLFKMVDVESDGKLCKRDIVKLMKLYDEEFDDSIDESKEKIQMVMKTFDEDGDGQLNYAEFCKLMDENDSDSD